MSKHEVSKREPLRAMISPFLVGQRRRLALLALSAVVGGFAEAGVLVLIARIAFALAAKGAHRDRIPIDAGPFHATVALTALIALAAALVLVRFALNAAQARLAATTTTSVMSSTRKRLAGLYLRASWSLQAEEREGRLQELLTTYTLTCSGAVLSLTQGTVAVFNLSAFILTAVVVSLPAALVVASAALLIGAVLRPVRSAVRRRSRRAADSNLDFATTLTELAATTQEVRIFEVEEQVQRRIDEQTDRAAARQRDTRFLSQLTPAVYQATALLLVVGALALAYAADFSGLASLGGVILIMLRSLTYGQTAQTSLQALHESAPYFETLQAEEARYRAAAAPRGGDSVRSIGQLVFEHVDFEYVVDQSVLHDVSFTVPSGEIVGIVGPSGAGKSTLVQLVLRLRDPTGGRILAGGRDVRELSLDDWYHHVTFVPQEPRLFAGTIADNIRFYREHVDDAAIERAARQAHLHDDIMSWPLGYETPAGERGGQLSGGQRQRLCIARALVEEPEVVVLDEPTSSLDPKSEALMRETMADLAPRTTVFVIAHRLSTLTICGRIMVIHDGELQGFDAAAQLEHDNPFFREILELSGMR